mmetsp:Transcript_30450/g.79788  ORF Transcript_30450/g.79788 Transcript_30450/m.79788 type:complete len:217 (+) Transcript_30450:350-1000(+)
MKKSFSVKFSTISNTNNVTAESRVLNPITSRAKRSMPISSVMMRVTLSNLVSVTNMSTSNSRPDSRSTSATSASSSSSDTSRSNRPPLVGSGSTASAPTRHSAPITARLRKKNSTFHSTWYATDCASTTTTRVTRDETMIQLGIFTTPFNRIKKLGSTWNIRLHHTKVVPTHGSDSHSVLMWLTCVSHCVAIRTASSRKVDSRNSRAIGRMAGAAA